MSLFRLIGPILLGLALPLTVTLLPGTAVAEREFAEFYGTILVVGRSGGTITLRTDTDESVTIDVSELGAEPYDVGAFTVDNVVTLVTRRVGDRLVAYGWEQARDGRERRRN